MRIKVTQTLREPLEMPIGYHHILQGIIYNAIRRVPEYSTLHDKGYERGKRVFRMFTFSEIFGKYKISGKKIIFLEKIEFWIASPDANFIDKLAYTFSVQGIAWGEKKPEDALIEIFEVTGIEEKIQIKMLSPICVYSTDQKTKRVRFYRPEEEMFGQLVEDNFVRKYEAFYGKEPSGTIAITPLSVLPKDKKITQYKNIYYDGWTGQYYLSGKQEYLEFLHDAGIGSKNSKGFGMFAIM